MQWSFLSPGKPACDDEGPGEHPEAFVTWSG